MKINPLIQYFDRADIDRFSAKSVEAALVEQKRISAFIDREQVRAGIERRAPRFRQMIRQSSQDKIHSMNEFEIRTEFNR